ncbi:AMP-binding protein [Thalassotalea piscium]
MENKIDITTVRTQMDMATLDVASISPEKLPNSIYDAIITSAQRYTDKVAIRYILDGDCIGPKQIPFSKKIIHQLLKVVKGKEFAAPYREISYQDVAKRVTQVANALTGLGVTRSDVTSIILPNFPEMYFSLWGAETTGIANPINPLLEASIIKEIITTSASKVLIALGPVPGSDIWEKTLAIKDDIPSLKAVISLFGDDIEASENNKVPVYSFEKLLKQQQSEALLSSAPVQDDICSYFHTGGTTGLPKLAKHKHLNEITNAAQINLISPMVSNDSVFIGLPIFHVNAAITGLSSIMLGSTILLAGPSGFRGKNVIKHLLTILDNFNIAFMTAVPTVYAGLLQHLSTQTLPPIRPKNMKLAICGAAPLSPDLQAKFIEKTKINLVEGYGSTEGTAVSSIMPVHSIATRTAVGLTIPGTVLRIGEIDPEGQLIRFCDTDESGEILIAGNNVFPGYVDEIHNENLWVITPNGDKMVRTGDLGRLDSNGYLSLSGRQKELIIRGGHNIDPKMIEDVASAHPEVLLAAAVPRPDSYSGELPVLYVTLVENSKAGISELEDFMKTHIPERAAMPKTIHIIEEMPLTAVGKMYKPELVCREIYQVIVSAITSDFDAEQYHITVAPDKKQGIVAHINIASEEASTQEIINARLAEYSFNYKVICLPKIQLESI